MMKKWEILWGDLVIPVTAYDVVETLDRVIPRESYHLLNDKNGYVYVYLYDDPSTVSTNRT